MKRMVNLKMYDHKVASIQAKNIYKKLLVLYDKAVNKEVITTEEIDNVTDSFTFFTDIVHLMDYDDLKMINITTNNSNRPRAGK